MLNLSREILQLGSSDPSEPNFGHQKAPNQPKSAKIVPEVAKSNPHYYREVFLPNYNIILYYTYYYDIILYYSILVYLGDASY